LQAPAPARIIGYGQQNSNGNNLYTMGKQPDNGYSALVSDLKGSGQLDSTLVVMVGEFGRTVGKLSAAGGRDHWLQQSAVFGSAGVQRRTRDRRDDIGWRIDGGPRLVARTGA
jgi:hypothetical protein